jgi:hypothetical protein
MKGTKQKHQRIRKKDAESNGCDNFLDFGEKPESGIHGFGEKIARQKKYHK